MASDTGILTGIQPAIARVTRERLRLRGLPPVAAWGARALVAVLFAAVAVIVLSVALGSRMPGGTLPVPQQAWPRVAFVVFLAGLAVVAGAAAAATALPGARLRAPTVVLIALATASVGARLLQVPEATGAAPRLLGGLCIVGAVALLAVAAVRWRDPSPALLGATAAFAPLAWLATWAWSLLAPDPSLEAALAESVRDYLALFAIAGGALVLWGTFALLRTARAVGAAAGRSTRTLVPALVAVLIVKAGWIGLGVAGAIPAELPLAQEEWRRAMTDGPLAWIVAASLVISVGIAVPAARRRVDERGVRSGFWILVGAFTVPTLIAIAVVIGAPIAMLGGAMPIELVRWITEIASNLILPVEVGVIVALPLLAVLAWRFHHRSVAATLAIAAAWLLPLGAATAWFVADRAASATPLDVLVPSQLAADALLTVAVAVLCLDAARTRRWRIDPRLLLVTLLVAGVAANTGLLVPTPAAVPIGGLLLVYPVGWTLLVDAGPANLPGPAHPSRVVGILAGSALLLLLALLPFSVGSEPDIAMTSIARILMAVPMAVALVLAWWGREQRLPRLEAVVPARERRLPMLDRVDGSGTGWRLAAGGTVLAIAVLIGWAYAQELQPRGMPAPTDDHGASPLPVAAIPAGEVMFGTALDMTTGNLIDPGHHVPLGTRLTWFAHLARPTSGSGLTVLLEKDGVRQAEVPLALTAGSSWASGVEVLDLLTDSVWRVSYHESGETLAEGTLAVGDAAPVP